MASEAGGRADKLGNDFERLCAVRHLIELVSGDATSFKMEPLGDDEKGVDFWVERPNGTREAHQCKRENGSKGNWSVSALGSKRIISDARFQLDRSPSHRFVFVSGDKAPHMSALSDRTGRCDSPTEFVTQQVTTSIGLKKEFHTLCTCLDLDPNSQADAERVVDFLRRFRPELVDNISLRSDVEVRSGLCFSGEPVEVVASLMALLDRSIGKSLNEQDVIASLPQGSRPRDLAKEPTLLATLDGLRNRFESSYRHLLIGGRSLGRNESAELVAMLTADDGPRLVLLHGSGGVGKSGIVFEIVEQLNAQGTQCLPLRLDRDQPGGSPLDFGKSLDLPASPANCLAVAAGGLKVLVLDQVDAIRWTAAHSAHAWDTVERTVSEALGHPNLRVLVVCRSFDLEDDPQIKEWEMKNKATKFKVEPLDDATVDAVISARDLPPRALNAEQRKVLRSPQGLYLWLELHEGDEPPPPFRTMTDLMRSFWKTIRLRLSAIKPGDYEAVLEALVTYMDQRGVHKAPRIIVEQWPQELDALLSLNVLVNGPGTSLLFSHQSSLDYRTAVRISRQVHSGEGTVLDWLSADDQSLFRRGQLRQLLALLRDDDPERFLESMKDLIFGIGVRFHLQNLALQMLGHSTEPTDEEAGLVIDMLERPEWVDHVFHQVLAGRNAWFDAFHSRGLLKQWLDGPDERKVNIAINISNRVVETRGSEIESLFLNQGRERWPGRLVNVVWRTSPEELTEGLFDAVVDLRSSGEWHANDFVNWTALAKASPSRCLRMLEARITRSLGELEREPAEAAINRLGHDDLSMLTDLSSLTDSAAAKPVESWDVLVPSYLRVTALLNGLRRQANHVGWGPITVSSDQEAQHIRRVLRDVLTAAGKAMARDKPRSFWERAESAEHGTTPVHQLINLCIPHGATDQAENAIRRLLQGPSWFRPRECRSGAGYRTAWKVLRRYSDGCSIELFGELQAAVLSHWPADERAAYQLYHNRESREARFGPEKFDVLKFNHLGLGQYLLLSGMSIKRLSPEARDRLGAFQQKFGPIKPFLSDKPKLSDGAGWIGTPIPDDRLSTLSDRNWLKIIQRDWSSHEQPPKLMWQGRLSVASIESFARDLGRAASLDPERFARLALRMPVDCNPRYPVAILRSLAELTPTTNPPVDSFPGLATIAQLESLILRFASLEGDREYAMTVCRAIQQRHDAPWDDEVIRLLSRLATSHADPLPDSYAISRPSNTDWDGEEEGLGDVAATSINCVRGSAAGAIKAALFGRKGRLEILQSAVDSLLADPHAAVRAAAVGIALPLYNIDQDQAVDTFIKSCSHPDNAVLTAYDLNHFLRYAFIDHVDRLRPLIERMIVSNIGKVSKRGAAWATVAWAHRGLMSDIVSGCAKGTDWERMGVADAISATLKRQCDRPDVIDQLRPLQDDPVKQVRDVAAQFFQVADFHDHPSAVSLTEAFLKSRAADDNLYALLHSLERSTSPLKRFSSILCDLADRFVGPLAAEARDIRTHRPLDAALLAKLLLRLYEQAEHDRDLRRRCLDAWDGMLRQGIGYDVLQDIDA